MANLLGTRVQLRNRSTMLHVETPGSVLIAHSFSDCSKELLAMQPRTAIGADEAHAPGFLGAWS
jgi:hypothetical protein